MSRVRGAAVVHIGQAGLLPVRGREPAHKMVEAAILHRYDYDVVNP